MTTKTISGTTITTGYVLSTTFSALTITSTGAVHGVHGYSPGSLSQSGGVGGVALTISHLASTANAGSIVGGAAGNGSVNEGSGTIHGGNGGLGVLLSTAGDSLSNTGVIDGGYGGYGGGGEGASPAGDGGAGAAAVSFAASGSLTNGGQISGGAGGDGGSSVLYGGLGGAGGAGVVLAAGGTVANSGTLTGGSGGYGAENEYDVGGETGGAGGAAILIAGAAGVVTNSGGLIAGGGGGKGGGGDAIGGNGGVGGLGVGLAAGGTITNTSGTIEGGAGGVGNIGESGGGNGGNGGGGGGGVSLAGAGSVSNSGRIAGGNGGLAGESSKSYGGAGGAGGFGADLSATGETLTNGGTIAGGLAGAGVIGYGAGGGAGGGGGAGVELATGDSLTNTGAILAGAGALGGSGLARGGVGGAGGAGVSGGGQVTNEGTIEGGAGATGGLIEERYTGGKGGAGGAGVQGALDVTNSGLIAGGQGGTGGAATEGEGWGGNGGAGGAGVGLAAGGALANTGTILGAAGGAAGAGKYQLYAGANGDGADLAGAGMVTNGSASVSHALLEGAVGVRATASGAVTVTNFATIDGTGGTSVFLDLASDRLIAESGSTFLGVAAGGGGTLELAGGTGSISGLGATGTLTGAVGMTFSGFGAYVVDAGAAWTLIATDALSASQVLDSNGTVVVAGSLDNLGTVVSAAADGLTLATDGTVTNGSSTVGASLIKGVSGVYGNAAEAGHVTNFGTLQGTTIDGAQLLGGGVVVNGASSSTAALIDGDYFGVLFGADTTGATGSLTNYGTVTGGTGGFVDRSDGGAVTNGSASDTTALIEGATGVYGGGLGTLGVTNFGAIESTDLAVWLVGGGQVVNGSSASTVALIKGTIGVDTAGAVTVTNFGTIDGTSGTSVNFAAAGEELILESGSTLIGKAVGDGGTLDLAGGTGTIVGLGVAGTLSGAIAGTFGDFATYDVNGTWTAGGLASGRTTLLAGDTLDIGTGTLTNQNAFSIAAGAVIDGGTAATLVNNATITAGGGSLYGELSISNAVDATIDVDAGTVLINNQYGQGVLNGGLIESTGTANLTLKQTTVRGSGTLAASGTIKFDRAVIDAGTVDVESGGVLQVASTISSVGTGVSLTDAGSIRITTGAYLYLGSNITGAGSISIDGVSGTDADLKAIGNVTLSGGGQVSMNADGVISGYGITHLTNADTVTGGGAIFGSMTLTNSGVIDDDAGAMLINNQNGGGLVNGGLMESTGTGDLSLKDVTVTGSGAIDAGHELKLTAAAIDGGTITVGTLGLLEAVTGSSSIGAAVSLTNDKTVEVVSGGKLTIAGAIANDGLMETAGTGVLVISGVVTGTGSARLHGSGSLTIDGTMSQGVAFAGTATGDLILGAASDFTGVISGLSKTGADAIDLQGVAFNAGDTAAYVGKTATLTIYSSSHAVLATLKLKGNYDGATWSLASDGSGGTLIKDPPASASNLAQAMAGLGTGQAAVADHVTSPSFHLPTLVLGSRG